MSRGSIVIGASGKKLPARDGKREKWSAKRSLMFFREKRERESKREDECNRAGAAFTVSCRTELGRRECQCVSGKSVDPPRNALWNVRELRHTTHR